MAGIVFCFMSIVVDDDVVPVGFCLGCQPLLKILVTHSLQYCISIVSATTATQQQQQHGNSNSNSNSIHNKNDASKITSRQTAHCLCACFPLFCSCLWRANERKSGYDILFNHHALQQVTLKGISWWMNMRRELWLADQLQHVTP